MNTQLEIKYIYFGSSRFSVIVLDELKKIGMIPNIIVTTPAKPRGRKLLIVPNEVEEWAKINHIQYFSPSKFDTAFIEELTSCTQNNDVGVFIVASYGKIIPKKIIDIPKHGILNIHPSLLPKYRGPSPLQTAMLEDAKSSGITIMKIDEEMDHGSIISQKIVNIDEWPTYEEYEELMARVGANLVAEVLPSWISGSIGAKEQDHANASYTKKIQKDDASAHADILNLDSISSEDQYTIFRKIQAYHGWPQVFFLAERKGQRIRVKITSANFIDGKLAILKVIPEGSKERTSSSNNSLYVFPSDINSYPRRSPSSSPYFSVK